MDRSTKDVVATALTALAVLVFATAQQGWTYMPLIHEVRWAAGAMLLLGIGACAMGDPTGASRRTSAFLSGLGVAALVLAVVAIVTGSLTWLWGLVAVTVVLWAIATARHAHLHVPHGHHPAAA